MPDDPATDEPPSSAEPSSSAEAPSPEAETPSLQTTISRLLRFWEGESCLLLPSCDFEIKAGTFNPETFFHLPGPEPWRAATLQPVRRPLDGRRSEHPYRLAKHLQLQVVLKPPPEDLQALYLRSLEAVGLELDRHDLRFAEWRYESRALDAWGSGWHVLVDGLGITRLTYLQHAAGYELDPRTVELSYGIERLTMLLARVDSASALPWSAGGPDYGSLHRRDETEFSRYVFEVADIEEIRRQLRVLEREARRCLAAGLARPTYELAVKSLLGIDILEAHGDLAARERELWSGRVQRLVTAAVELERKATARSPRKTRSTAKKKTRADGTATGKTAKRPRATAGKKKEAQPKPKPRKTRRSRSRKARDGD